MRRFLVNFHVMVNGKKIHAIRDVRLATGMGLGQSKTFCETFVPHTMDSTGGNIICNGEQVARLLTLDIKSRGANAFGQEAEPTYAVMSVEEIKDNALDISGCELY